MKLPNVDEALVETPKITEYLLSDENSGGKSAFFTAFGFRVDSPDTLRQALISHAKTHDVVKHPQPCTAQSI